MILSKYSCSAETLEYADFISAEGYDPPSNECPDYNTKDGEAPVMELWGICRSASFPLLPGPL